MIGERGGLCVCVCVCVCVYVCVWVCGRKTLRHDAMTECDAVIYLTSMETNRPWSPRRKRALINMIMYAMCVFTFHVFDKVLTLFFFFSQVDDEVRSDWFLRSSSFHMCLCLLPGARRHQSPTQSD